MKPETTNSDKDDDLEKRARAEVRAILGRSVPIRASTLAEALAVAERLKADWMKAIFQHRRKCLQEPNECMKPKT